ncbi:MAG: flippase [Ignavibacteriales bacterium]|nr:flippase [Ignavibacteriales bacterium]
MKDGVQGIKTPRWMKILPEGVRAKIVARQDLQRIFFNTGWLVFDKIFRMGVGLVVGVWIARYLGPGQFGSLNYAISLSAIFGSIAGLGLENIVVREIVKNPLQKETLLGTSFVLRLAGGFVTVVLCLLATYAISSTDPVTRLLVFIIAVGYVFQALDVVDLWFQSKVQSKYSVISKNIVFFSLSAVRVLGILLEAPLLVFAILATMEIIFGGISLLFAYRITGNSVRNWNYSGTTARNLLRDSWPLVLSGLAIVIYMKVDQVLLGSLMDMNAVGIYSAAVRMAEVWYFIPGTITVSVFPSLIEARKNDYAKYLRWLQKLYDGMAGVSIFIALLVTFFSGSIIGWFYGTDYLEASPVLTVYVWSGVATFLGVASSQYLMVENLLKYSMYRTTIGMLLNVALNLLLIPTYGIQGSAVATLASYFASVFSLSLFSGGRGQSVMMIKALFVPRYWYTIKVLWKAAE